MENRVRSANINRPRESAREKEKKNKEKESIFFTCEYIHMEKAKGK